MELGLAEKVIIVTGAGRGLGRAMALGFAKAESFIVVNDIEGAMAERTTAEVLQHTKKSIAIQADVSSYDDVGRLVDEVIGIFGRVDILINNAAIFSVNRFTDTKPQEWTRLIEIDLVGYLNTIHAVLPHMIERRYGKIVNISSAAAKLGGAYNVAYSSAKGGVNSLVKAVAREVGRYGINVNAVCPGMIKNPESDIIKEYEAEVVRGCPLGRLGDPSDVVDLVIFLASDRASYITGQTISVDGGFTMQ